MPSVMHDYWAAVFSSIANRNYDQCSRWAVARRTMQDGTPYSLEHYPYIEGIIDSRAKYNWIMKATQVGLTEAGITIANFEADYHQRDVIYYFPTKRMGERFSKTRFAPAINLSEYLHRTCTNNSVEIKQFGNATIHILGANSVADLKGTAAGRLVFDELDDWTPQQIYAAEERASGAKNDDTIIWGFSTPKYPNLGIHKQFMGSTQERFRFDCPHCRARIELRWPKDATPEGWEQGSFHLKGERVDDPAIYESYIKCYECQHELRHADKLDWLRTETRVDDKTGERGTAAWEQTHGGPELMGLKRGFYLPQLYSPTVAPYKIALKYLRGHGDEAARRTFFNDCVALPYTEDCYQVNDTHIDNAIHKGKRYSFNDVLPTCESDGYYTLGVDQGGKLHSWVVVDWIFDKDRRGDPNDRADGQLVACGRILEDNWGEIHDLMETYQIRMCVIDYWPQPTNARTFARAFQFERNYVYLCQYVTGRGGGRELVVTEDDYGASTVKADKVGWLSKTLGRIMVGRMNLPLDLPFEFRRQLMAPVRSMKKVNNQYISEFMDTDDDHYAHAMNYAEIALKILDPSLHTSSIITKAV